MRCGTFLVLVSLAATLAALVQLLPSAWRVPGQDSLVDTLTKFGGHALGHILVLVCTIGNGTLESSARSRTYPQCNLVVTARESTLRERRSELTATGTQFGHRGIRQTFFLPSARTEAPLITVVFDESVTGCSNE